MRREKQFKKNYAVTEIIGGILLVAVAVVAFSAIYFYLYPPPPDTDILASIEGSVTMQGDIVLEHVAGDPLTNYRVIVKYPNGSLIGTKDVEEEWRFGEKIYPLEDITSIKLIDETTMLSLSVYSIDRDNEMDLVFEGTLQGHAKTTLPPTEDTILISSLRTDTTDEDLLCFNYSIEALINPLTNIYSWIVDNNSITDLLYSFDTNSFDLAKDYSSNNLHGDVYGPTWTADGKVGGGYIFDGDDDYISIPYCFQGDYIGTITIETWIKTSSESGCIARYDKDKYWDLSIKNGKIQWSTTIDGNTVELNSVSDVNDDKWHLVAVNYDYSTGFAGIYIDGLLDSNELVHNPGSILGDATNPNGHIGLGFDVSSSGTIFSTSFESQSEVDKWSENDYRTTAYYYWDEYIFEILPSDSITPRTGSYSIGGSGDCDPRYAAYDREGIDISNYNDVKVSVWYSYKNTEYYDELGFYYWDGDDWVPIFEDFTPEIGEGNQLDWTYAEAEIPDSIDNLILEFWWSTSHAREYVAIDDLEITGTSILSVSNFSGLIDEFKIYNRILSDEQIYQNYLCSKNGFSDISVIVSDETSVGQYWKCNITPNDSIQDDNIFVSNILKIKDYGGG